MWFIIGMKKRTLGEGKRYLHIGGNKSEIPAIKKYMEKEGYEVIEMFEAKNPRFKGAKTWMQKVKP